MAKNQNRRLSPKVLKADEDAFSNLKNIEDYRPSNDNFTKEKGEAFKVSMDRVAEEEATVIKKLSTVRDKAAAAAWNFHNYMLGVKTQVSAQYGEDSNELQSLGVKKKSEYKRPTGRKKKDGTDGAK